MTDQVDLEVDEMMDYIDDRIDSGSSASDIMFAMAIILKLVTEADGSATTLQ